MYRGVVCINRSANLTKSHPPQSPIHRGDAADEWVTAGEVGYITLTEGGKETSPFLSTSWR